MTRLLLLNPNTDARVTEAMLAIAYETAGNDICGLTAPRGSRLITTDAELAVAAEVILSMVPDIMTLQPDVVIVGAFGDPSVKPLRQKLGRIVVGLAEAAMAEAAAGGRRFGVVTTTPGLEAAIVHAAQAYGHRDHFAGTWFTTRPARAGTAPNAKLLVDDLAEACERALRDAPLDALIVGGGPLAVAARVLAGRLPVPLIEPIPAAVRLALRRLTPAIMQGTEP